MAKPKTQKLNNKTGYDTGHCWFYLLSKKYPSLDYIKVEALIHLEQMKSDLIIYRKKKNDTKLEMTEQSLNFYESYLKNGSEWIHNEIKLREKAYLATLKEVDKEKKKWEKKGVKFVCDNHFKDDLHSEAFSETVEWCTGASLTHNHLLHAYTAKLILSEKVGTRTIGGKQINVA